MEVLSILLLLGPSVAVENGGNFSTGIDAEDQSALRAGVETLLAVFSLCVVAGIPALRVSCLIVCLLYMQVSKGFWRCQVAGTAFCPDPGIFT